MELDEAIKHAEEVAEAQEEKCKHAGLDHYTKLETSACAAEHRQLAEWLKELKRVREQPWLKELKALREQKRPRGEWKPDGTCSECGVYSSLNKDATYFCPNCGADMREGG